MSPYTAVVVDPSRLFREGVEKIRREKPGAVVGLCGFGLSAYEIWQERYCELSGDLEAASEIAPQGDPLFRAGFGQAKEGVASLSASIASGSSTDLPPGHLAANVVL